MKIAQYEYSGGRCVGIQHKGIWINYSKAEAFFTLKDSRVAVERMNTIAFMLETGMWDPSRMRQVLDFVGRTNLLPHLALPKTARLKAPLQRPPKIVALGLNYVLHAKEGSFDVPREPIIFVKVGSSVIGPEETVRIPRGMGRMDHEVELAVVIGRKASEVRKREAYKYVAGYTIVNDVSARDVQTRDLEKKHPWFRSKSYDTFTPMGPWIATADELPHPVHVDLECRVNGKVRQKANTRDLVFDIPTVIEFITRYITLDPGDVISTGTPAGIGPIKHGDMMVCTVQGIGSLRNPVRFR
jgi:5-oxopent-3-ene-1,2,5-tricarboxylate decarboxylase/2-hydroxyhepta-2,4-diene-1,7-dioate isomerase